MTTQTNPTYLKLQLNSTYGKLPTHLRHTRFPEKFSRCGIVLKDRPLVLLSTNPEQTTCSICLNAPCTSCNHAGSCPSWCAASAELRGEGKEKVHHHDCSVCLKTVYAASIYLHNRGWVFEEERWTCAKCWTKQHRPQKERVEKEVKEVKRGDPVSSEPHPFKVKVFRPELKDPRLCQAFHCKRKIIKGSSERWCACHSPQRISALLEGRKSSTPKKKKPKAISPVLTPCPGNSHIPESVRKAYSWGTSAVLVSHASLGGIAPCCSYRRKHNESYKESGPFDHLCPSCVAFLKNETSYVFHCFCLKCSKARGEESEAPPLPVLVPFTTGGVPTGFVTIHKRGATEQVTLCSKKIAGWNSTKSTKKCKACFKADLEEKKRRERERLVVHVAHPSFSKLFLCGALRPANDGTVETRTGSTCKKCLATQSRFIRV